MRLTIFLFVANGLRFLAALGASTKINVLGDFLTASDDHRAVETYLCWNKGQTIKLLQLLTKLGISYAQPQSKHIIASNFSRTFVTDMCCQFFNEFFQKALADREVVSHPNRWIIFGSAENLTNLGFDVLIDSNVVIIDSDSAPNEPVSLKTIYKLSRSSAKYFENTIAQWSPEEKLQFLRPLIPIKNRRNFFGMPLRVSYVVTDNRTLEYDVLANYRYRHIDNPTKINYFLYEHLVDFWNMTLVKLVRDEWGFQFHPTELFYKGMLGDLSHDRADVAGTVQFTPKERVKYFKYLVSTTKRLAVYFVFRAPPLPYSSNLFAQPFDTKVWIGCGIILSTCCLVIWIITMWENRNRYFIHDREIYKENSPGFLDVLMGHVAAISQMSYSLRPRSSSAKVATFSLLLGFCYIYNAFCARIVLLLQSTASNLHDYKDLYEAKMDMGVEGTPYNIYYFSNPNSRTNEEWRRLIYDNKIAPKGRAPKFYAASEGIKLVKNAYFAFHVEYTTACDLISQTFTRDEVCSVRIVDSIYQADRPYLACHQNSSFTEYFLIG